MAKLPEFFHFQVLSGLTKIGIQDVSDHDFVEVVRCADCKWFQCNMRQDCSLPHNVSEYECRHWCGPCDPTDCCSYGEPPKEVSK